MKFMGDIKQMGVTECTVLTVACQESVITRELEGEPKTLGNFDWSRVGVGLKTT